MDQYVENMLHVKVTISDYSEMISLPLYLSGNYRLNILEIAGIECLLAEPREDINLSLLRKHRMQLKKLTQMECVLFFVNLNIYTKQKLIEEAIPFILRNKQIYMPFVGIVLTDQDERLLPDVREISYLTQKLLLVAIYQKWDKISLTDAAKALCISKMSVTRCFDELDVLGIPLIKKVGRNRYFVWEQDCTELWNLLKPFLRNPVAKEYHLEKTHEMSELPLGGISALSSYTLLNDNGYRTYAITKDLAKKLQIDALPCVPKGEEPAEIIQVVQYEIPYGEGAAVDPLTAILSISNKEQQDPRVETAIDEVLEERLNDKRN
jgi:hypothetical protein